MPERVVILSPDSRKRRRWRRDGERWRLDREKRFGDEQVLSDEAHGAFREIVALDRDGYNETRKGTWVRPVDSDIFQLVEFRQGKNSYNLFWGVSLTYMPHAWEPQVKLHRTLKSARFDLHDEAMDHLVSYDA